MYDDLQELPGAIESALAALLPQSGHKGARQLDDALHYAVFPGGKRLRPMLCLLGARFFGHETEAALPAACAVEFIHTSSLIFDDLPCMDDAQVRRGRPVLHLVYGEDAALLAGIALLNQAYALFGRTPNLIREATECIGVQGMIGGQALDLSLEPGDEDSLLARNRKTSAMMRLALTAGALGCGASPEEVAPLASAGQYLGDAYQIGDDLLDARRTSTHTGKTAGQDRRHNRPSHLRLDEAACHRQLHDLIQQTHKTLEGAYEPARVAELMDFVDSIFASLTAAAGQIS